MKTIKILLGALIVVAGFISCTKEIELDEITSTGVENIENDEFNAKSDTYKGQVRRCRIRTVYRPKRTLNIAVGSLENNSDASRVAYLTLEFNKTTKNPLPTENPIKLVPVKSKGKNKKDIEFQSSEFFFEGETDFLTYEFTTKGYDQDGNELSDQKFEINFGASTKRPQEIDAKEVIQKEFDVILSSAGAENLKVVDVLLKYTSLSKEEAYKAVYNTPYVVMARSSKEEANQLKAALEAVGATVDLK